MPSPPSTSRLSSTRLLSISRVSPSRIFLPRSTRLRIVNRILDTLQRCLLIRGQDGVTDIRRIATRFEEKIYFDATDQNDYLRRISLKMLNLEIRAQHAPNNMLLSSTSGANQSNGNAYLDATQSMDKNWRTALSQDRQKFVNKIMDTLQRCLLVQGQDGINALWKIANHYEEEIYNAATDEYDYLWRITQEILNLGMKAQDDLNNILSSSTNDAN